MQWSNSSFVVQMLSEIPLDICSFIVGHAKSRESCRKVYFSDQEIQELSPQSGMWIPMYKCKSWGFSWGIIYRFDNWDFIIYLYMDTGIKIQNHTLLFTFGTFYSNNHLHRLIKCHKDHRCVWFQLKNTTWFYLITRHTNLTHSFKYIHSEEQNTYCMQTRNTRKDRLKTPRRMKGNHHT